jgi:hypothetical protein
MISGTIKTKEIKRQKIERIESKIRSTDKYVEYEHDPEVEI